MSLLCFNFNVAMWIFASLVAGRRHILNLLRVRTAALMVL